MQARVSIHALLAECDQKRLAPPRNQHRFNPRTPCGVRPESSVTRIRFRRFQSTHSLRSATAIDNHLGVGLGFQSTHSLRSATALSGRFIPAHGFQSTHSLRSATQNQEAKNAIRGFQSTHSLRSATNLIRDTDSLKPVSIHALLAECDHARRTACNKKKCFNPRTPCGVRPACQKCWMSGICFNPRTPCGVRLRLTISIVIQ